MDERMSLEQVRDSLRNRAKNMLESENYLEGLTDRMAKWFDDRADAIDAHLANPAQTVDVGAIKAVIARIEGIIIADECILDSFADKLKRAIGEGE